MSRSMPERAFRFACRVRAERKLREGGASREEVEHMRQEQAPQLTSMMNEAAVKFNARLGGGLILTRRSTPDKEAR